MTITTVGKKEFIQNTSKYLKMAESHGEMIITHRNQPALKLIPIREASLQALKGLNPNLTIEGDVNESVLPGYDEW